MINIPFLSGFIFLFSIYLFFLSCHLHLRRQFYGTHISPEKKNTDRIRSKVKWLYGDDVYQRVCVFVFASKSVQNKNNSIKLNEFIIYGKKSYVSRKQNRTQNAMYGWNIKNIIINRSVTTKFLVFAERVLWRRERRRRIRRRGRSRRTRETEKEPSGCYVFVFIVMCILIDT